MEISNELRKKIHLIARSLTNNETDVQDCIQEAELALFTLEDTVDRRNKVRKKGGKKPISISFNDDTVLFNFLKRVAENAMRDYLRKERSYDRNVRNMHDTCMGELSRTGGETSSTYASVLNFDDEIWDFEER